MVHRRVVALLVLALLVLGSGGVAPAQARTSHVQGPAQGYYKDFYSDASLSQYIGTKTLNCDGTFFTYGSTSPYYTMTWYDCY